MQQRRRIWIDQDGILYDLHTSLCTAHNKDYPQHELRSEHVTGWDTQKIYTDAGCLADIYSYFDHVELWRDGKIIDTSKEVINHWHTQDIADLGIITTASNAMSMPYKVEWLQEHFPYIEDILVNYKTHVKHLLRGDILIDDGLHNLEHWQGIGILYNQPWNKETNKVFIRANNWDEVDWLVRRSLAMLDLGLHHKEVEWILSSEQNIQRGKG